MYPPTPIKRLAKTSSKTGVKTRNKQALKTRGQVKPKNEYKLGVYVSLMGMFRGFVGTFVDRFVGAFADGLCVHL
jgi:hypothetical protein